MRITARASWSCLGSLVLLLAGALLAEAAGPKVIQPFNGKDQAGWKTRRDVKNSWVVGVAKVDPSNPAKLASSAAAEGKGELINIVDHGGVDLVSEQKFGDCTVCLEVMVPKGSNSGIYLMGNYEIQILDSFGRDKVGPGDMGGLYGASAPRVNACKAPGEWQQYVIEFQAPRFQDGKKTGNAVFKKVTLNGQVIHENVEMKGVTGGALTAEQATGPLMFQGDHGPVAFRNIKITVAE